MTNASNPYLTVKAVAKKRLATPIALVCAFFGVAVAYSTVELFLRGETGSGVISCFLFAAVMTPGLPHFSPCIQEAKRAPQSQRR